MKDKSKKGLIKLIVGILLLNLIIIGFAFANYKGGEIETIQYTEFLSMVEDENIEKIIINNGDQYLTIEDSNETLYLVSNPNSMNFKEDMLKNGIKVLETNHNLSGSIVSLVSQFGLMILVLALLSKDLRKSMSKVNVSQSTVTKSNVKFCDVAGQNESIADMKLLVNFLKNPDKYVKSGATLPKGALLYGPPGTGKTLTAKAIAGEAGVPFIPVSGSDFVELFVGNGARKVRKLFADAREKAPCIIFIDEIDSLASNRNSMGNNSEKEQTMNALLAEMDGFVESEGIIVLGATNRLDVLDPAILRPGRFDRHIAVELPDLKGREEIFEIYLKGKKLSGDITVKQLAKMTPGFSGADIAGFVNEAAILSVDSDRSEITSIDIDTAYIKIITKGHLKENHDRTEDDTELVAYHEAGHALLSKLLTNNSVPKVSIIPTTSGAGGFTVHIPERIGLLSKKDIEGRIMVLYGGRAAEELLRGDKDLVTSGASNDIEKATELIRAYIEKLGMSEEYGLLDISQYENEHSLEESKKMSKELYDRTFEIISNNKEILNEVAEFLIENETMSEEEFDHILEKYNL